MFISFNSASAKRVCALKDKQNKDKAEVSSIKTVALQISKFKETQRNIRS